MQVKDIISKSVVMVDSSSSVVEAAKIMDKKDIGSIIVTIGGEEKGIMTERDILKKVVAGEMDYRATSVGEVMSSPLITVDSTCTIEKANETMNQKNIRRLVVTEGGKIVGIITSRDISRSIRHAVASRLIKDPGLRHDHVRHQ